LKKRLSKRSLMQICAGIVIRAVRVEINYANVSLKKTFSPRMLSRSILFLPAVLPDG